jgi:type IV secretion system protein VirD4
VSFLARSVGWDGSAVVGTADIDVIVDSPRPKPGREIEPRTTTVTGGPGQSLVDHGIAFVRRGGGYTLAIGGGAAVCELAGVPAALDLILVGACGMHAWNRVLEKMAWASKGGWVTERRRRKYQGEANPLEVRFQLSVAAAAAKMKRLAPDLPAGQSYIPIGVTAVIPRQQVAVSRAETILVVGPPQTLKTALLSNWAMEACGALLATSSRADQWRHTVAVREKLGEVYVLDADGYGPGTNFSWDPVAGCRDPRVAIRRAGDFMQASPRDPGGKDRFHEDRGAKLLRWALHAASLSGGNMVDVREWVNDPERSKFADALHLPGASGSFASGLESLLLQGPEYLNSAVASAEAALGWMDDPDMVQLVVPENRGIDIPEFLAEGTGSVYLIGSERPYGSLTPLFTAFASEFLEQARVLAEAQGGRLRTPLTIVADEAATTARIDFKRWCAVTAGYNVTVIAGLQSISQLSAWGASEDQETILELFSTKVIAGGCTGVSNLERLSVLCGTHDVWRKEKGDRIRTEEPVFPPGRIRMLADFHALVVQRNCKSIEVIVTPVWLHQQYQQVTVVPAEEQPDYSADQAA